MKMDDLKKVIAKLIRENFHQSISEATYDFGKKQYTDKNMTPTEILDLAMAYAQTPVTKIVGNKHEYRVRSANDLAKLTGTTQSDVKTRGKQPALILFLLKNELVSKEEYAKLYKVLLAKQIEVIRYLKNSSPEMRNSGGAMRAAEKDGRGELIFYPSIYLFIVLSLVVVVSTIFAPGILMTVESSSIFVLFANASLLLFQFALLSEF